MTISYANLLLADPDESRSAALAEPLQRSGWYAVYTAGSRQEMAVLLQRDIPFDLLLVSLPLLTADNYALLFLLRRHPRWHELPIIALASPEDVVGVSEVVQLGVQDYLLYPENLILLQARINGILQTKLLQEQYLTSLQAFNEMKKLADDLRETILPLGMALSSESDDERLLEKIVTEAKAICNADAATLYLRDDRDQLHFSISITSSLGIAYGGTTGKPAPYAPLPLYDPATGKPNHHNIATHVVHEGHSVSIPDIYAAQGFDFDGTRAFDDGMNYRSISCLTVPLQNDRVIGVLQLLNAQHPEQVGRVMPFSIYHQLVVESLASQAALVLHNQELQRRQQALLRYERELRIGRQIQQSFFPETLPQPAGWELAVAFHSAREVAGDFYDAMPLPNGRLALAVADVCDKGVVAALFMALIRSLIRALLQQYYQQQGANADDKQALVDVVAQVNSYILDNHWRAHMFATLFIGVLDVDTGQLVYINGGHNPPLLAANGVVRQSLPPTGPAVGVQPFAQFTTGTVTIELGELLLAYTDGVVEARDGARELFGEERLYQVLAGEAESAAAVLAKVETAVQTHLAGDEAADDLTMLGLRRLGSISNL